MLETGFEF